MPLRDYQSKLKQDVYDSWQGGARNVLAQLPTGGGKTVVKAAIVEELNDAACCIAHRRELVSQISLALAREGVRHRIIAPDSVIKFCAMLQVDRVGRSFVYPNAPVAVAGVDSLLRPSHALDQFAKRCALWVQDEAHHLLAENKWGRAINRFTNARGLGVTATPCRTDGKGLGRHAHGVMDRMVLGPTPRELTQQGYLSDYRIICARDHIDGLSAGGSGEYTGKSVDEAMRKSRIIGDIVPTWLKHANGLKTVVFAHNLEAAKDIADEFKLAGVRAAAVSSKNTDSERVGLVRRFELGDLDVLVNVDLFGEGFDLPALECVVMARPTASLGLYMQQFGRVLRVTAGKLYGLVIDHVGNVMRHGLPDAHREWTLDARPKRQSEGPTDAIPLRTCSNVECMGVYERIYKSCPYCQQEHVPGERGGPEHVDGDLYELDAATLARLRGEADRFEMTPEQAGAEVRDKHGPAVAIAVAAKRHAQWQQAQTQLRAAVEQWSGYRRAEGLDDSAICKLFYFRFGVDILSAYSLKTKEAYELLGKLKPGFVSPELNLDPAELGALLPDVCDRDEIRPALYACGWDGNRLTEGEFSGRFGFVASRINVRGVKLRRLVRAGLSSADVYCVANGFEKRDFGLAVRPANVGSHYGVTDAASLSNVAKWLGYVPARTTVDGVSAKLYTRPGVTSDVAREYLRGTQ